MPLLTSHKQLDQFILNSPLKGQIQILDRDSVGFDAVVGNKQERFDFPFDSRAFDEILDTDAHKAEISQKRLTTQIRESLVLGEAEGSEGIFDLASLAEFLKDAENGPLSGFPVFKVNPNSSGISSMLLVTASLDGRQTWNNDILENSRFVKLAVRPLSRWEKDNQSGKYKAEILTSNKVPKMIARTGTLEQLARYIKGYLTKLLQSA